MRLLKLAVTGTKLERLLKGNRVSILVPHIAKHAEDTFNRVLDNVGMYSVLVCMLKLDLPA